MLTFVIVTGYFLIMLNSLLMFYSLRKFLGRKNPAALESILYYLFAVLGIADCEWHEFLAFKCPV